MIDECPLPRVKRTFGDRILQTFKLMSAFLQSGRAERQNLREIRVRFRPQADVEASPFRHLKYALLLHSFAGFRQRPPGARRRIIETDQLQHLVMLFRENPIQLLSQRSEA